MPEKPVRGRPRRGPDPERLHEITAAAAELFLDQGYSATTIQDVAESVGVLKGSLYHYVRSKEDFLYLIIKDVYDRALVDMRSVAELDATPLVRLAAFVRAHVLFAADHLTAYTIQLREFDRLGDERRREIRAGGQSYLDVLRGILGDGQAAGVVDPALDVRVGSLIITGELNAMTRWYRPGGHLEPSELADEFVQRVVTSVASARAVADAGGIEALRRASRAL
jgi:TetR/AcrR family transcriptional regulator, cholesterol catabolism regulator